MRYSIATVAAFAGLLSASPLQKRQEFDVAAYNAIPVLPDVGAPAGDVVPAPVVYDATSVAAAAAAAATDLGTGSDAVVAAAAAKRSLDKRSACDATKPGSGPTVNNPDTAEAFVAYGNFSAAANNATVPVGYQRIVTNASASAQDSTYLTYKTLTSYDTAACAAFCQSQQGCNSFNIYFERDPAQEPGYTSCKNPASTTYIKCALFKGILTPSSATNKGGYQADFHVVIAGSDIYTATTPATPSGFTGPYNYNNASINAPSGYMGVQTFPQTQGYDPSVCAAACDAKSAYDIEHGLPSADKPDVCEFFVAYIAYKNSQNGVFTCTYYTSQWDSSYATNTGYTDTRWNDKYTIGHSNGFAKEGAPQNGVFPTASSQVV